jgi:hypothetical protein
VHDTTEGHLNGLGSVSKGFQSTELFDIESIKSTFSSFKSGNSCFKFLVYNLHLCCDISCNDCAFSRFDSGLIGFNSDLVFLGSNDFGLFSCILFLFFDNNGSNLEVFFELGNLFSSFLEFLNTLFVFFFVVKNFTSLFGEHLLEQGNEFKERLGSGVDVTLLSLVNNIREGVHSAE